MNSLSESPNAAPRSVSFREALRFWWLLGWVSFGGPAGQIGIMHRELVTRRKWISEQRFLHALNYCLLLPGPEAQQLATYIGWLLHGISGGLAAGILFVAPGFLILVTLSALYVYGSQFAWVAAGFEGVKPVVVAIVAAALWRIGRKSLKTPALVGIACGAWVALALAKVPFPVIVVAAGSLGLVLNSHWLGLASQVKPTDGHQAEPGDSQEPKYLIDDQGKWQGSCGAGTSHGWRLLILGLSLWGVPLAALFAWQGFDGTYARMGWFFSLSALVTFGGAYAVLPYVSHQSVQVFGWLRQDQMLDGLALGETTPGPLILIVAFVGFLAGYQGAEGGLPGALLGASLATYFTFLPSFLFIFLGAPVIERTRGVPRLNGALTAIGAAVSGVMLDMALTFARACFWHRPGDDENALALDGGAILVSLLAGIALIRFQVPVVWVVLSGVGLGILRHALGG